MRLLSALLIAALLVAPAPAASPVPLDRETRDRLETAVDAALQRAGRNRTEIESFLAAFPGDDERALAARFLVANMPIVDLASMTTAHLRENHEWAFRSREAFPWVADVPLPLFLHYVLPHRATQEPFEPWRAQFAAELESTLQGCTNMIDAALAVNRWCGQRVRFVQTEFRDQNALMTLRCGYGRCEELMILCIDAMRAAGIPARPCSAPWWVVGDNNHAWVEVWADGHWYWLGGCEPADSLDAAWFNGPVQRAGVVVSTMFGSPDFFPTGEAVAHAGDNMAVINSTSVYAATDEITVTVVDSDGDPQADHPVVASCINYGGLRPLLRQTTDEAGRTTLILGMGEYAVTSGGEAGRAFAIVRSHPGSDNDLTLTLAPGTAPPETFWLRYPTVAEAQREAARRPNADKPRHPAFTPELPPPPTRDLYEDGKLPALDAILNSLESQQAEQLRNMLTGSGTHWRELAHALLEAGESLDTLILLFETLSHLDRVEVTAPTLLDHATAHRREGTDRALFIETVLNPCSDLEHAGLWRSALAAEFAAARDAEPHEAAQTIRQWIADNLTVDEFGGRLGPVMHAGQVYTARRGSKREITIFAVAALRSLGIPARKHMTKNWVEYHDGQVWQTMTVVNDPESSQESSAGTGGVQLVLIRDERTLTHPSFSSNLAISAFENGAWSPLRSVHAEPTNEGFHYKVPPGEYLVTAAVRNANGDPWTHTALINVTHESDHVLTWSLDLPDNAGIFEFPKARTLESLPEVALPDAVNDSLRNAVADSAFLLVLVRTGEEPTERMMPLIREAWPTLEDLGARAIFLESDVAASALGIPTDTSEPYPAVILFNRGGDIILWSEGMNLEIDTLLREAARHIR